MANNGQGKVYKVALVLLGVLILYNIGSGLIVKKIGIPGIFEVEFGDKRATSQQPAPAPPQQEQPQQLQQQNIPPALQSPSTTTFARPQPLPQNTCQYVPGMFWMTYPNTWYGPFSGYALAWDNRGGFYVWDPYYETIPFPDPYEQVQRNTWLRLHNTPFNICVDLAGSVFGQYSPQQ